MISAIVVTNLRGDPLLTRNYRADEIGRSVINAFKSSITKDVRVPTKTIGNHSFLYIKVGTIFIVAITRYNVNAAVVFELLHTIAKIYQIYFGAQQLTEETIKTHVILAWELLEETVDWGYPQNTDLETLKPFVTQKGAVKIEKIKSPEAKLNQVTGAIPWRSPDLKYKKNEIFIDIIESVNILVSTEGKTLRADVSGQAVMKTHLSGMPECKFGINDKVFLEKINSTSKSSGIAIDDCTFHQCVRLGKFDRERAISFIPPDGEFELMKYRTTQQIEIPFQIVPIVKEISKTRMEVKVSISSIFKKDMNGEDVKMLIPLPKNTATCKIFAQTGRAKYSPEVDGILWKIKRFPGETKVMLRAEVEISASVLKKQWSRPPISLEFQVPMFAASGLNVRFLKVIEQKQQYKAIKWVRYLTKAGSYQFKI
jgi:AP-2 complex subunit mu-1